MPEKYKPGVGWAVVTPPNFPLGDICGEYEEYEDGDLMHVRTGKSHYGAVFRSKARAVTAASRWPGAQVVKVSVTLWRKDA